VEDQVIGGEHPEFEQAYRVATAIKGERTIARIAFSHLVSVYQAARGDVEKALDILSRTGYESIVTEQRDIILREFTFVANWLAKYAPASVKFAVQDSLPKVELSDAQLAFLDNLASSLESARISDGQTMHDTIYEASIKAELKPAQAFQALYRVILGQDSGPKAGWFLASLESEWLVQRLRRQA
jgi:lysyl-tRNA synthetase class 1